jgi:hypothetical protein
MLMDDAISCNQCLAPALALGSAVLADGCDVVNGSGQAGEAFVILRARLPTVWYGVILRTNFVGAKTLECFARAVDDAEVRTKELVRGTRQKVATKFLNIDQAMRRVMHSVNECQRSRGVGHANNFVYVVDGSDCICGVTDSH